MDAINALRSVRMTDTQPPGTTTAGSCGHPTTMTRITRGLHVAACASCVATLWRHRRGCRDSMRYPYELKWLSWHDGRQRSMDPQATRSMRLLAHFTPDRLQSGLFPLRSGWVSRDQYPGPAFSRPPASILSTIGKHAALLIRFLALLTDPSVSLRRAHDAFSVFRAWMDIAEADSLCLVQYVLHAPRFVGRRARTSLMLILLSGALFSLAYFVKQGALPIAAMVVARPALVPARRLDATGVTMVGVTSRHSRLDRDIGRVVLVLHLRRRRVAFPQDERSWVLTGACGRSPGSARRSSRRLASFASPIGVGGCTRCVRCRLRDACPRHGAQGR